ncbi:MAG: PD-(D/E)XK nuclease family protein [Acidobacteriota bacterium]
MIVAPPSAITRLDRISPTLYEAAMKCTSRASWLAKGDRTAVPAHPRALLGIAVHGVLERARTEGNSGTTDDERRADAEASFDERVQVLFASAHPLLRAKFEGADRLPFYHLFRARAAQMALDFGAPFGPRAGHDIARTVSNRPAAEAALASKDGRVVGRADVLDPARATVLDYKTGDADHSGTLTEPELRQLRLYAYLGMENGITISRGVIERADRTRVETPISSHQAEEEGQRALLVLDRYNEHAGKPFEAAATPSPDSCRFCPCIPFCEAFWRTADIQWSNRCGTHVEGVVASVSEGQLISIDLEITRGTGPRGAAVATRLSRDWLTFPGAAVPHPQQTVRLTDVAHVGESDAPLIFRADRVSTAVWTLAHKEPLTQVAS